MMRARTWLTFAVLAASLLAQVAAASDFQGKRFNLVPFVGWTFFDREIKAPAGLELNDDVYFGGRVGVRVLSPLWLDIAGGYTGTKGCNCDATWTHLSANLMLVSSKPRAINPFISLGGGVSKFVPPWSPDQKDGTFEAAAGLKVKVTNSIGLRLEARNVLLVPAKNYSKSHIDNIVAGAGLVFAFGGRDEDSDGDGVTDHRDKCPDTPHGCTVDADGCPSDSDGDGVCDGRDQCPNTPKGCKVDAQGCPIDSDGDGVCDGLDQCPNTVAGATVDAVGCVVAPPEPPAPAEPPEIKQRMTELLDTGKLVLTDVNFEFDKSDIRPESYNTLDIAGKVLTKWPGLQIEIGGHTDSRGSDAYNRRLSDRRAASVRTYLLAHFPDFKPEQITSKGYGESEPRVPNDSEANMAINRRVEFKVLNKEILEQTKR